VTQLNGTWDKGHGTREGLSYRQIVRWANRQVGRRQRMASSEWRIVGVAISHDGKGSEWRIANGRGERQFALKIQHSPITSR
jgi:hypothetical protein